MPPAQRKRSVPRRPDTYALDRMLITGIGEPSRLPESRGALVQERMPTPPPFPELTTQPLRLGERIPQVLRANKTATPNWVVQPPTDYDVFIAIANLQRNRQLRRVSLPQWRARSAQGQAVR